MSGLFSKRQDETKMGKTRSEEAKRNKWVRVPFVILISPSVLVPGQSQTVIHSPIRSPGWVFLSTLIWCALRVPDMQPPQSSPALKFTIPSTWIRGWISALHQRRIRLRPHRREGREEGASSCCNRGPDCGWCHVMMVQTEEQLCFCLQRQATRKHKHKHNR